MRSRASFARRWAIFSSTIPAPARMVSAACESGLSPSATAAAMPAWAQRLDAPSPNRAAETTVTGSGASFSAVNRPARPAPTMTRPPPVFRAGICVVELGTSRTPATRPPSNGEMDHALYGHPGALSDILGDRDLLFEEHERLEDFRQRNALHVRAKIARPHELDVRHFDGDVVAHRALGHEQHLGGLMVL